MSQNSGGSLGALAEATSAWNDETRHSFDKRHAELIERKMAAYNDALIALQQEMTDIKRFIDSLRDS